MSGSVIRLICPFLTKSLYRVDNLLYLSQICNGFEPIEYKIERNPL